MAGAVLGVAYSRWLRADGHVEAARRAEAKGDWPRVAREARAAVALDAARARRLVLAGHGGPRRPASPPTAARALQEAVARDPFNPSALANLGFARAKAGDRAGAADALRRAVGNQPRRKARLLSARRAAAGGGRRRGSAGGLPQGGAAWPSDPRPQYRRGLLALRARRLAEAEEALRAAVALDPSGAGAHKALGVVLWQGGRRDEAATQFQEALRLDAAIADRAMMERVIADAGGPRS